MRLIIAGSRNLPATETYIMKTIRLEAQRFDQAPTRIISGAAKGVDRLGEAYGDEIGVMVQRFPAQWDTYGKAAGPMRNGTMAEYGDALLAIWDGKSRGTRDMINRALSRGLDVRVKVIKPQ